MNAVNCSRTLFLSSCACIYEPHSWKKNKFNLWTFDSRNLNLGSYSTDHLLFALLKRVRLEGYYLLAGSAKLKAACHTLSSLPFDLGNIFPKCDEMGELVWTCQWLPLLTYRNSNLVFRTEGARMPSFSFENNSSIEIPIITVYIWQNFGMND